jgi:pimeloyl-ACP methyl ester carboxylesterase
VVGIILLVFVIYPLNRAKTYFARADIDEYNADSMPLNDPAAVLELNAAVDTFRVEADGLTSLACLYLTPLPDSGSTDTAVEVRGTAILLHNERQDRTAMIPLATRLLEANYAVCLYDQRASGFSTGEYHSDGEYEASDLAEVIAYLAIRDLTPPPLVAVGEGAGADAALMVAVDEQRLDAVVAIEPYLTSDRWLEMQIDEHDMYWIPLRHTLLEFWYELRSGYAPEYRRFENLESPACRTVLLMAEENKADEAVAAYLEMGEGTVQWLPLPDDTDSTWGTIRDFLQLEAEESSEDQE